MEETSPVKPSVAELAGKFKSHTLPVSSTETQAPAPARPPTAKLKGSPLIEKLQANLTLTPTPLLTIHKSPEAKLQATPLCIISPCESPGSALRPPQASKDEVPVSFEQPAEGAAHLLSVNKTRVRLSFKRRLPSRQHRKSIGEEPAEGDSSPSNPLRPDENGDDGEMFSVPPVETEVNVEVNADDSTCPERAAQLQDGPSTDESVPAGGTRTPRQGQEGEAANGGSPDAASTSDTIDLQHEDQSPEQMECVEEIREEGVDRPTTHTED
ncbi:capZ-interacting protein [Brachyhypopomus gauderio]|uniref:capZ-interacting protein n=1 Tax=Brachyhypopomus gauderio TaxID=698409 RepID=UPI00404225B0